MDDVEVFLDNTVLVSVLLCVSTYVLVCTYVCDNVCGAVVIVMEGEGEGRLDGHERGVSHAIVVLK